MDTHGRNTVCKYVHTHPHMCVRTSIPEQTVWEYKQHTSLQIRTYVCMYVHTYILYIYVRIRMYAHLYYICTYCIVCTVCMYREVVLTGPCTITHTYTAVYTEEYTSVGDVMSPCVRESGTANCYYLPLFCYYLPLFCYYLPLFCYYLPLFCYYLPLFCHTAEGC